MLNDAKQDVYMKLHFARYFHVSPEDAAVCLGVEKLRAPNAGDYKAAKESVLRRFYTKRGRGLRCQFVSCRIVKCESKSLLSECAYHARRTYNTTQQFTTCRSPDPV
jgi:hypothetical protein